METIVYVIGAISAAVIAPFAFTYFTRAIQVLGSTRAQETAAEKIDDQQKH